MQCIDCGVSRWGSSCSADAVRNMELLGGYRSAHRHAQQMFVVLSVLYITELLVSLVRSCRGVRWGCNTRPQSLVGVGLWFVMDPPCFWDTPPDTVTHSIYYECNRDNALLSNIFIFPTAVFAVVCAASTRSLNGELHAIAHARVDSMLVRSVTRFQFVASTGFMCVRKHCAAWGLRIVCA